MLALLNGTGLQAGHRGHMAETRVGSPGRPCNNREPGFHPECDIRLSWTPGWGYFESPAEKPSSMSDGRRLRELNVVIFLRGKTGIVVQSVSDLSIRISPAIVRELLGDIYSPFSGCAY